jgi:hypothetical protein
MLLLSATESLAAGQWEKQGQDYYLGKNNRDNFSAISAGANKFSSKYKNYDGVDFWVRGEGNRRDYGRLDLQGNNLFSIPIRSGMKIDELHFLAGGNVGNSYEQDDLLRLYGDNYYYAVISVIFVYQDGGYKSLAVPVFWDWFHLGSGLWSRDGASIKSLGNNPVRKDCTMFHLKFVNPRPAEPIKDILVTDSWLADRPFSEIFALTLKSSDMMEAAPREDRSFPVTPSNAAGQPPDSRTRWQFDKDLDGWSPGNSPNWDAEAFWQAESYAKTGVVIIPGCNWAGDKTSWIEKKVALPDRQALKLEFSRHSAAYSQLDKLWTDGALKVIVKSPLGQEVVYEKMYSGQWSTESVDLSKYKGKTVILRFENHGGGSVRLGQSTSSLCDGEDAIIDDIRLKAD